MISLWPHRMPIGRPVWVPVVKHCPLMPRIVAMVAAEHGLPVSDVMGPSRCRRFTIARNQAYWLCRKTGRLSTPQIARFFGKLDHTTVINGSRRHAERLAQRPLMSASLKPSTDSSPEDYPVERLTACEQPYHDGMKSRAA